MRDAHDLSANSEPFSAGALATFVAIHQAGSISEAAARLHLSQPAVSRRLTGLERQLGVTLFDRTPPGLRLTDAGRALLPHAGRALAAESDARRAMAERLDDVVGAVELGVVGSLVELYLTDALRAATAMYPDLEIEVTTATSAQVRDLVLRGELTIGVSYAQPVDRELEVRVLTQERLTVVCAPDHPLAGSRLRKPDLRHHRWLVFPDRGGQPETSGTIARRTLERHHVPAERLRPIDSLSAQRALAMAGHGLALLPWGTAAPDIAAGRLAAVHAPALETEVPITLLTRRTAYLGRAAQALVGLITTTWC